MSLGGGGFVASALQVPTTHRVSYVPAISGSITNVASNLAFWWRIDQHMFVDWLITFNGNGGLAADLVLPLPPGFTIDTSSIPGGSAVSNQGANLIGEAYFFIQGGGWKFLYANFNTTSSVYFVENTQHLQANEPNAGDGIRAFLCMPIAGW